MSPQKPGQPLPRKSALQTFGLVFLLLAVAAGASFAWKKYRVHRLTVAETREVIREYLEARAEVSRFNPARTEEVATNASGADASGPADDAAEARKPEKKKKKKAHPPNEQLVREFRRSIKESPDYKSTYRLIGENLARVDVLMAAGDPEQGEAALLLAAGACRAALDPAVDGWLAARIAEAYLWPNLENAPATNRSGIDAADLLDTSEDAFKAADETDNIIRNYRLLIARGDHPAKTDKLRVRLAKLLENEQHFTEALQVLHEVQDTNSLSFARRVATVEMLLQQSKPKPSN